MNRANTGIMNKLFSILIVYYWMMMYLQKQEEIASVGLVYLLLVLPISAFVFFSMLFIKRKKISNESIWIIIFMMISGILSIARVDFRGLMSAILFGSVLISIFYYKLQINLKLVNSLFLISIVLSIPLYYSGLSIYGFLPGQSHSSNLETLAGRISIFPNVTSSIYFSFMIFLLNFFFNQSRSKLFFILLSLYFIFFGISRTVMLVLILVMIIYLISTKFPIGNNIIYSVLLPIGFIGLPILLVLTIENIISFLLNLNNDFISSYFFRGYRNVDDILSDVMRTTIWSEHTRIFLDNPWGIKASEISKHMNTKLKGGGSESFLTRILMQYGFGAIFIYVFLFSVLRKSMIQHNIYMYIFVYLFIFIGFNYGSFFNVYNALFLIFIASINNHLITYK